MKTAQWVSRGLPLVLIAMIGVVVWMNAGRQEKPAVSVACADLVAGCVAHIDGRAVSLGVSTTIKPLKPFQVWVKAAGVRKVEARFTMEGMEMGFNLYPLHADSQGVFRSRVTLPICITGRRDWVMTLELDGARLAVPFVTDL